jgi:glutamate dehydrogenase
MYVWCVQRKMVKFFNRSLLSASGFLVLVDEVDVRLPGGTLVPSGVSFRNNFHLNSLISGDFFVPCGGRPAAVNADNVEAFLYGAAPEGDATLALGPDGADGGLRGPRKPRYKYIVEGANLFFTSKCTVCSTAGALA